MKVKLYPLVVIPRNVGAKKDGFRNNLNRQAIEHFIAVRRRRPVNVIPRFSSAESGSRRNEYSANDVPCVIAILQLSHQRGVSDIINDRLEEVSSGIARVNPYNVRWRSGEIQLIEGLAETIEISELDNYGILENRLNIAEAMIAAAKRYETPWVNMELRKLQRKILRHWPQELKELHRIAIERGIDDICPLPEPLRSQASGYHMAQPVSQPAEPSR